MKRRIFLPGTKYLLLDVRPDGTSGVLISLDDDKRIHLGRRWDNFEFVRHAHRLRPLKFLPTVIISASRELVYTSTQAVRTERENPMYPMTPVELENTLGRLLTGMFTEERRLAAETLKVEELDAVLVGSRVTDFRLDGNEVVNPIGQKGRRVSADFEITFVTRPVFNDWKNFFNSWKEFYLTETTHAFLRGLQKGESVPAHILIAKDGATMLYTEKGPNPERWTPVDWDPAAVTAMICRRFGLPAAAAADMLQRYRAGKMSPTLAAHMEAYLRPLNLAFTKECKRLAVKGKVFVYSQYPWPFECPKKIGAATFEEIPITKVFHSLGFSFDPAEATRLGPIIPQLFSFLEFYYDNKDSSLNYWLKRRVHWLAPVSPTLD